jgi:LuxR family transcriptional regulator, quorum-sensing system regulator SolR
VTLNDSSASRNMEATAQRQKVQLTKRQREILSLTAQGKTSWEISVILGRREVTVNYHIKGILKVLRAQNKAHAVNKAILLGLLTPQ